MEPRPGVASVIPAGFTRPDLPARAKKIVRRCRNSPGPVGIAAQAMQPRLSKCEHGGDTRPREPIIIHAMVTEGALRAARYLIVIA
jgi:hypothetical protein